MGDVGPFGVSWRLYLAGVILAALIGGIFTVIAARYGPGHDPKPQVTTIPFVDTTTTIAPPSTTTSTALTTTTTRGPTEVDLLPGVPTMLRNSDPWVCSGDIKIHRVGGAQEELFDNDPRTGLVVVVPLGATFRVETPRDGGYCRVGGREAVPTFKAAMSKSPNCKPLPGCPVVNVVMLDPEGNRV